MARLIIPRVSSEGESFLIATLQIVYVIADFQKQKASEANSWTSADGETDIISVQFTSENMNFQTLYLSGLRAVARPSLTDQYLRLLVSWYDVEEN